MLRLVILYSVEICISSILRVAYFVIPLKTLNVNSGHDQRISALRHGTTCNFAHKLIPSYAYLGKMKYGEEYSNCIACAT